MKDQFPNTTIPFAANDFPWKFPELYIMRKKYQNKWLLKMYLAYFVTVFKYSWKIYTLPKTFLDIRLVTPKDFWSSGEAAG